MTHGVKGQGHTLGAVKDTYYHTIDQTLGENYIGKIRNFQGLGP